MPTIIEAGVPGYETYIWLGIFAPKNTPADIVARMNREIEAVLQTPEVRRRLAEQGAMAETMTPAKFRELMVAEQEKWMKVVREANIGED